MFEFKRGVNTSNPAVLNIAPEMTGRELEAKLEANSETKPLSKRFPTIFAGVELFFVFCFAIPGAKSRALNT